MLNIGQPSQRHILSNPDESSQTDDWHKDSYEWNLMRQERMRRMRVHYADNGASIFLNPRPQNRRIWPGQSHRGRTRGLICWRTILWERSPEYTRTVPPGPAHWIGPGTDHQLPGTSVVIRDSRWQLDEEQKCGDCNLLQQRLITVKMILRSRVRLVTLVLSVISCDSRQDSDTRVMASLESGSVSEISSMVGSSVSLPCNMTSSMTGDRVRLVLWFREDKMTPVYSLDSRGNDHHYPMRDLHRNSMRVLRH